MTLKFGVRSVGVASRDYFKACGIVMADRLINRTYGLDATSLSIRASQCRQEYPRFGTAVDYFGIMASALGVLFLGRWLKDSIGSGLGYTAAYLHQSAIALTYRGIKNKLVQSRTGEELPFIALRHDIVGSSNCYFLAELVSLPAYNTILETMNSHSSLSSRLSTGLLSMAIASIFMICADYRLFYSIWKKNVLGDVSQDDFQSFKKGLLSELNPLRVFRRITKEKISELPSDNDEYTGQLEGISESHYFWLQLLRFVRVSVALAFNPGSPDFLSAYYSPDLVLFDVAGEIVGGRNRQIVEKKIEQNNRGGTL